MVGLCGKTWSEKVLMRNCDKITRVDTQTHTQMHIIDTLYRLKFLSQTYFCPSFNFRHWVDCFSFHISEISSYMIFPYTRSAIVCWQVIWQLHIIQLALCILMNFWINLPILCQAFECYVYSMGLINFIWHFVLLPISWFIIVDIFVCGYFGYFDCFSAWLVDFSRILSCI